MNRTHYPTNPADWTDGDWQMSALEAKARENERLIKAGRCPHGWNGPSKDDPGIFVCYNCGHLFGSRADRNVAMNFPEHF